MQICRMKHLWEPCIKITTRFEEYFLTKLSAYTIWNLHIQSFQMLICLWLLISYVCSHTPGKNHTTCQTVWLLIIELETCHLFSFLVDQVIIIWILIIYLISETLRDWEHSTIWYKISSVLYSHWLDFILKSNPYKSSWTKFDKYWCKKKLNKAAWLITKHEHLMICLQMHLLRI